MDYIFGFILVPQFSVKGLHKGRPNKWLQATWPRLSEKTLKTRFKIPVKMAQVIGGGQAPEPPAVGQLKTIKLDYCQCIGEKDQNLEI